jgi:hypothetical protein
MSAARSCLGQIPQLCGSSEQERADLLDLLSRLTVALGWAQIAANCRPLQLRLQCTYFFFFRWALGRRFAGME